MTPTFDQLWRVGELIIILVAFFWKRETKNEINQSSQDRLALELMKLTEGVSSLQSSVQQLAVQVAKQQVIIDLAVVPSFKGHAAALVQASS